MRKLSIRDSAREASREFHAKRSVAFGRLRGVLAMNGSGKESKYREESRMAEREFEKLLPSNMRGMAKPRRRYSSLRDSGADTTRTSRGTLSGTAPALWAAAKFRKKGLTKVEPIQELANEKIEDQTEQDVVEPELVAGSERVNKFKRAKFGVLLSILERSPTGGKYKLFVVFKVIPVMLLFLDFLQLNKFNAEALSPSLTDAGNYGIYLFVYDIASFNVNSTSASFFGSLALVILCVIGIGALTIQFLRNKQKSILFSLVGGYMTLLTTLIYMPIIKSFASMFNCDQTGNTLFGWEAIECGTARHKSFQFVGAMGILSYVPLCMFISQNNFEHDPHGNHILRRPSGRFAVVNLTAKTVLAVSQTFAMRNTQGLYQTWVITVHTAMFLWLLMSFRLLLPYYDTRMNKLHALFLGAEVVGVLNVNILHFLPNERALVSGTIYPLSLVFLSPLVSRIQFHAYFMRRYKAALNFLFQIFDLANDPSIPYKLGLDHLIKTATRCGYYADFLHRQVGDEKTARFFYQHALRADPYHASNLGKNANFCFATGNVSEAKSLFKRAMEVDPDHVENLGLYARFLSMCEKDVRGADALYRRSVGLDPNHTRYQGMYSASSDALLILDQHGFILDCNGTALRMFNGSTRDSLLNLMLLDMMFVPPAPESSVVEAETSRLRALADTHIRNCVDHGTVTFMWTFQSFVSPNDSCSSMKHHSNHVASGPVKARRRSFDATAVAEEGVEEEGDPNNRSQFSLAKTQDNHRQLLELNGPLAKYAFQAEVLLTLHHVHGRNYIQASLRDVAKLGKLVEKERQFVSILENIFDAVILVDYFGTIKTVNTQTLDLFGFKHAKHLEKKNVKLLIPAMESENELSGESKIPQLVSSKEHSNLIGTKNDGNEFTISARVSLLSEQEKEMKNTYCIVVRSSGINEFLDGLVDSETNG